MKGLVPRNCVLGMLGILVATGVCGALGRALYGGNLPRHAGKRYDSLIRRAANRHMPADWDWRLLKAMVRQESNFDPAAVSHAGAVGLCQLLPSTAATMDVSRRELRRPAKNVDAGARYLRYLYDRWPQIDDRPPFRTRTRFALASYNAGPSRVRQAWDAAGKPRTWPGLQPHMPRETQKHVHRIMDSHYPLYCGRRWAERAVASRWHGQRRHWVSWAQRHNAAEKP